MLIYLNQSQSQSQFGLRLLHLRRQFRDQLPRLDRLLHSLDRHRDDQSYSLICNANLQ